MEENGCIFVRMREKSNRMDKFECIIPITRIEPEIFLLVPLRRFMNAGVLQSGSEKEFSENRNGDM